MPRSLPCGFLDATLTSDIDLLLEQPHSTDSANTPLLQSARLATLYALFKSALIELASHIIDAS